MPGELVCLHTVKLCGMVFARHRTRIGVAAGTAMTILWFYGLSAPLSLVASIVAALLVVRKALAEPDQEGPDVESGERARKGSFRARRLSVLTGGAAAKTPTSEAKTPEPSAVTGAPAEAAEPWASKSRASNVKARRRLEVSAGNDHRVQPRGARLQRRSSSDEALLVKLPPAVSGKPDALCVRALLTRATARRRTRVSAALLRPRCSA